MAADTLVLGDLTIQPPLVAPAHMVDGPNGSVIADPSKIVPEVKPADPNRPAGLPEKFKTVDELIKSYNELESKQGKPAEPVKPAITPADAAAKGVDLKALGTEFSKDGKLSEKSYTDLAAKGFDRAAVDTYIAGVQAQGQAAAASLAEVAGGADKLTNVLQWAQTNLSPAEAKVYNDLLDAGNIEAAKLSLSGIVSRYAKAVGTDPALVTGAPTGGVPGIVPFQSQAQVVEAMSVRDSSGRKKYEVDPAYRANVERRLSISFNG